MHDPTHICTKPSRADSGRMETCQLRNGISKRNPIAHLVVRKHHVLVRIGQDKDASSATSSYKSMVLCSASTTAVWTSAARVHAVTVPGMAAPEILHRSPGVWSTVTNGHELHAVRHERLAFKAFFHSPFVPLINIYTHHIRPLHPSLH
jgi:hypothetical protein